MLKGRDGRERKPDIRRAGPQEARLPRGHPGESQPDYCSTGANHECANRLPLPQFRSTNSRITSGHENCLTIAREFGLPATRANGLARRLRTYPKTTCCIITTCVHASDPPGSRVSATSHFRIASVIISPYAVRVPFRIGSTSVIAGAATLALVPVRPISSPGSVSRAACRPDLHKRSWLPIQTKVPRLRPSVTHWRRR